MFAPTRSSASSPQLSQYAVRLGASAGGLREVGHSAVLAAVHDREPAAPHNGGTIGSA